MLKLILCVTALVVMVTAAPVQQETKEAVNNKDGTPLLRAKRSDEVIMFGNHQNVDSSNVVKKSYDDEEGEDVIDRNAKMETSSDPAENLAGNPDIKDATDDAGDLTVAELLAEETLKQEAQEHEGGNEPTEGNSENEDPSEELLKSGEEFPGARQDPGDTTLDNLFNYYYYRDNPEAFSDDYDPYRVKRSAPKARKQRSISAFTAEGMGMTGMADTKSAMRVKRDLTEEDIEALLALEGGNGYREDLDYPAEYYDDEEYDDGNDDDLWERLEAAEAEEEAENYQVPYEEFAEETAYPVSDDELARARERVELLNLVEENPDLLEDLREYYEEPYEEEQEEEGEGRFEVGSYPGGYEGVWEEAQEEEPEPQIEYRSVVYDGQPGIFIPVKRQYISMVPGVRKRDFYPYSEEPEGHWGAFVGNQEKRNEEAAYERLYRLAQALRAEDEYKKK